MQNDDAAEPWADQRLELAVERALEPADPAAQDHLPLGLHCPGPEAAEKGLSSAPARAYRTAVADDLL